MFRVNYVIPNRVDAPAINVGDIRSPIVEPNADWKGISAGITLVAECHSEYAYCSKLDYFQQSSGWFGDNNVVNNKFTGEVSYCAFAHGAKLASRCEPTNAFYANTGTGTKQVFYKVIAYPTPVSITETVNGPEPKYEHDNYYYDSIDMHGYWQKENQFFLRYSVEHTVERVRLDGSVQTIQHTEKTYKVYCEYNPDTRRWSTSSSSWSTVRPATQFYLYFSPLTRTDFSDISCPNIVAKNNRNLFSDEVLGDLALRAMESFKTNDVNMISYCKELPGLPQLAIATIKAMANLDNPKTWADLFLSTKYGWIMSYKDTMDLAQYAESTLLQKDLQQTVARSSGNHVVYRYARYWDCEFHFKIKLGDSSTSPSSQLLKLINSGFWPTAANLWDLVPYSFVVNWLTGIQGVINALDANLYAGLLPVAYCTYSVKNKVRVDSTSLSECCFGDVQSELYERRVRRSIPYVPLQLGDFSLDKHILESGALIVQHVLK